MRQVRIKNRLSEFDGRRMAPLEGILATVEPSKQVLTEVISLTIDPDHLIQTGSTWLLKNWSERGAVFTQAQLRAIFASLPEIVNWEARLHICQMLPHVSIPKDCHGILAWFLERCLLDDNKYLRAWAYNGFYELASRFPAYNYRLAEIIDMGEAEKSAAVRARIRNIRKLMNRKKTTRTNC